MSSFEEQVSPHARPTQAIVFADVCGSTQLFERHGNERALEIVSRALTVLSDVTVQYGGEVVKTIGDEVMSTFSDAPAAAEAAAAMQKAVESDALLVQMKLSIKIGFHFGEVILEEGDVFGDAVNVAARMVGLAKADQIMTTQATVDCLPPELQDQTRSLGRASVHGKQQPIEICEVLWYQERGGLTMVAAPSWEDLKRDGEERLVLEYGGERVVVEPNGSPVEVGRDESNDLVVRSQNVSRAHATIEFKNGSYVLTDRSTNGTYLRIGAEEVFVHRDQSRLLRGGSISLGAAFSDEAAELIQYRCE